MATNPPVPFPGALTLHPDARVDLLEIAAEVSVITRCRCDRGRTFLVRLSTPGRCAGCGTVYVVKQLEIAPEPDGAHGVRVGVGPMEASPIVPPHG